MFFKKFFIIFIFLLNVESQANTNIAFVNIDYLFENSTIGKSIKNKLKDINQQKSQILKDKEKNLVEQENEIKKIQNIITKDELNKKIAILKKNIKDFNTEKKVFLNRFDEMQNDELQIFFSKINPIMLEYMDTNSIDLLIEKKNIFIGKSNIDITEELLLIINSKIN